MLVFFAKLEKCLQKYTVLFASAKTKYLIIGMKFLWGKRGVDLSFKEGWLKLFQETDYKDNWITII